MTTQTGRGKTFKDLVTEAKTRIKEIPLETLKQWQAEGKDFTLMDVREADSFAEANIPGAVNLARGLIELEIDEVVPNQDAVIVTYCGGGSRSALAADTLQVMGYSNVYSLAGGIKGWKAAQ